MNNFGKRQGVKIEGPFYKYSEKLASLKLRISTMLRERKSLIKTFARSEEAGAIKNFHFYVSRTKTKNCLVHCS